ncbi:MAG: molybdopterin oxidoreductase, partial [Phycisphaerae bacterium]
MSRNPDKITREFEPGELDEALRAFDRRSFLKLMGAGLAMAGVLEGCARPQPQEKIVPYVNQPEGLVPGKKLFYASTLPLNGWGYGVVVEQHEGRPTTIEGNPDHPSSLGGTNVFMQASVLELYDPDRMRELGFVDQVKDWGGFLGAASKFVEKKGGAGKVRLRVLTGTETS